MTETRLFYLIHSFQDKEDHNEMLDFYTDIDNEGFERKYEYEVGKCIAFSSNFLHSTAVGTSSSPSVLLSMTFGTDRMVYWDAISKTAANQGQMYRLPNGCFVHKNFD